MSRKPNHWTIDQDPEWKIGESSVTRIGEFENGSAYAPKQKDFERREPSIFEEDAPANKHRHKYDDTVPQDNIEIVGGGSDVGLAELHSEERCAVGHRGRHQLLEHRQNDTT